mgnify:CR=1 FL=1
MLKLTLITLLLTSGFLTGCAEKNKSQPTPQKLGKPLPEQCETNLAYTLSWAHDRSAYSYTISVGLRPNDFSEFFQLDGEASTKEISLERNLTYYVRVEKQKTSYETIVRDFNFFVPSCANRADWKTKNPDYNEPRHDVVEF